jgi:hypothetical protein
LYRQTLLCSNHKKNGRVHVHYAGEIPIEISRPIRAGILLDVNRHHLVELITTLLSITDAEDPKSLSEKYITEVALFDRVRLADNCFWGDDSASRVKKDRYKSKRNANRHVSDEDSHKRRRKGNPWPIDIEAIHKENVPPPTASLPQAAVEELGQVTTYVDPEEHIWDTVVHLIWDDPKMIWHIWDMHIAPVLGFPSNGIATFHIWKATYNWDRGHQLLLRLADRLSVRYNRVSLLTATDFEYEDLLVAVIGHIRNYTTQTISSYVAKLLGTVDTHAQFVD